jgi:GntR family transcriptional repressor for pyruvate dehydrogenase complex
MTTLHETKLTKITMADQVFIKLRNSIIAREFQPGQRLPSEADLAKIFGVNRLTIRIAIQKLNSLGILETKIGDGSYVNPFNFWTHIEEIADFYTTSEMLNDVYDFRRLIEVNCALLAIKNATEEDLANIEEAIAVYESKKPACRISPTIENLAQLAKSDLEIHRKICIASHNELYLLSFSVASKAILNHIISLLNIRFDRGKYLNTDLHDKILLHIKEKNPKKLRSAYMEMIGLPDKEITE